MQRCYHKTILCVAFLRESRAVLDIRLLDNGSLLRALRPAAQERFEVEPGWRVSATEEGKGLRKTVWAWDWIRAVSQFDGIWRGEMQQHTCHCRAMVGKEQGRAVSYTK